MSARIEQMNTRLLARYGGAVDLYRTVTIPGENSWDQPTISTITEGVQFIATEAGTEWVSIGVILAGDVVGIMSVPETAELNPPMPGYAVVIDGKPYIIQRAEPVHSDPNSVIHFTVQVR